MPSPASEVGSGVEETGSSLDEEIGVFGVLVGVFGLFGVFSWMRAEGSEGSDLRADDRRVHTQPPAYPDFALFTPAWARARARLS